MQSSRHSQRINSLDLIRGVAICGLAPINIQDFATPDNWLFAPEHVSGPDTTLWIAVATLGFGKFITLFSVLFGASMTLQTRALESRSQSAVRSYLPRLGWLWLFGMLHAYFVWWGDILVGYAVTGFLVFWCRNWSAKNLAILGGSIYIAAWLILTAIIAVIFVSGKVEFLDLAYPAEEESAFWDFAVFTGPWWEQMPLRAAVTLSLHLVVTPLITVPFCGSLMLLGMSLYKSGFFESKWKDVTYRWTFLLSIFLGFGVSLVGMWLTYRDGLTGTGRFKILPAGTFRHAICRIHLCSDASALEPDCNGGQTSVSIEISRENGVFKLHRSVADFHSHLLRNGIGDVWQA